MQNLLGPVYFITEMLLDVFVLTAADESCCDGLDYTASQTTSRAYASTYTPLALD